MAKKRFFFIIVIIAAAAFVLAACGGGSDGGGAAAGSGVGNGAGGGDVGALPDEGFVVCFLDVGQADSAVVCCDGQYMLIDGGNVDDSSLLYAFLKSKDITPLDYVVGTHEHEDHIGGIAGALKFADAGKVYCSADSGGTKAFANFKKAAEGRGCRL